MIGKVRTNGELASLRISGFRHPAASAVDTRRWPPTLPDYYQVLGVARRADADAVRAGYRLRAKRLHPDTSRRSDAAALMVLVNEAFRVLSDPPERAEYDRIHRPTWAAFDDWVRERGAPGLPERVLPALVFVADVDAELQKRHQSVKRCGWIGGGGYTFLDFLVGGVQDRQYRA